MSIRLKILLVVLPLLAATLLITGIAAVFSAETGITGVAINFLGFKAEEVRKNADTQWTLLVANNLTDKQEYVDLTKKGIQSYAQSVIRSPTELIFALDKDGNTPMETRSIVWKNQEKQALLNLRHQNKVGWQAFEIEGVPRVGQLFEFEPLGWFIVVSEAKQAFYQNVREINLQNYTILGASLVLALLFLLFFTSYITRPISKMVKTMQEIIGDNNLGRRVDVEYSDEIGRMAQTFNMMLVVLEQANTKIKELAVQSIIAQKTEQKIRNVFQKYVPADVIDEVLGNPEAMLIGENRKISILFSDIRSFTTISESMHPDELVKSLNRYFSAMVDVIMSHDGIVDKYIGDAIMAIFGAPIQSENDALLSILSGFEMIKALEAFNQEQIQNGKVEFHFGIGINYGEVTVGNIGSEKKMNYTVIGDNVNLASRLEGLTKKYKQILLFSESVYQKVGRFVFCRMVDKVVVKGKTQGECIYTAKPSLTENEKIGWATWHSGLKAYYDRDFTMAESLFNEVLTKWLPGDVIAQEFLERAQMFSLEPPPMDWTGMEIMHEK